MIKDSSHPLQQIYDRQKALKGSSYMQVFSVDDTKKKRNSIRFHHFDLNKNTFEDILLSTKENNLDTQAVFINLNPMCAPSRKKQNIKQIQYVFIDLDDAKEDHNQIITTTLDKLNIKYSYNCQSGSGFHILVPIALDTKLEPKIKGFLKYLKDIYCDKVDLATADTPRLFRVPESIHNKKEPFTLKTIFNKKISEQIIKSNSELILEYQAEINIKGKKDIEYQKSINKEDTFFKEIFFNTTKWSSYYKNLDDAKDRNNIFIKNIGIYLSSNSSSEFDISAFIKGWEPTRYLAVEGWAKKAKENNMSVNYLELLKWAKDNKIKEWVLLLQNQTKSTFLDNYEFYYLEDEKTENAYLLYFPEKNYYVQKSLYEVLNNIYYDCLERGINLVDEFNLESSESWEEKNFKTQLSIIFNKIHKKIITENRVKKVFNINYEPSNEKFVYDGHKKFFNIYNKTELWDYDKKFKTHKFDHIEELLMNLCGDDKDNYNYFNKWLAWIIQKPTEKLPTAIILQGAQGSGKGTFKNCILDNIFGNNCQEINQTQLEASFNDYLLGKQIIVANEIMHNENRQTLPNVLKNLVTDEMLTINIKFKKPIVARNYCHWIFCTNSDNPIKLDADDRRYSVFYSKSLKGGGRKAAEFVKSLKENLDHELHNYVSYLKSLEVDYYEVHEPIMTEAKKEIQELNKDSIIRFIESLKEVSSLDMAFEIYTKDRFLAKEITGDYYIATDAFYILYLGYCEKFGEIGKFNKQTFSKKLKINKIINEPKYVPEDSKTIRVISLKNLSEVLK